jgi:hypothetical protein
VAAPHLADATVLRKAKTRLTNPRIEAKTADELLRRGKNAGYRRSRPPASRHSDIYADYSDQPLDCRIAENGLCQLAIEQYQVLSF